MAVSGKGAEGIALAALAMAQEMAADYQRETSQPDDAPADADEPVPEPRDP